MDYKIMVLSTGEKAKFYCATTLAGILIGWIFYDNLGYGIVMGILFWSLEGEYKAYLLSKRNQELLLQFRDFLYSLSSSVATGRSIGQGIVESYDFWLGNYEKDDYIMVELELFIEKMQKSNIEDIWLLEDFGMRSGLKDIKDVAMICRICKKIGGNLPKALSKCSDIIGDKISLERELHTVMIQKKFEGYIIALVPILMMFLMKCLSPGYVEPLTQSNLGHLISTISLSLILVAWLTIERMNNLEV